MKSKFNEWYEAQNETTKTWLDAKSREDDKLILLGMIPGFLLGVVFTIYLML